MKILAIPLLIVLWKDLTVIPDAITLTFIGTIFCYGQTGTGKVSYK
jgi:hypothetical protein